MQYDKKYLVTFNYLGRKETKVAYYKGSTNAGDNVLLSWGKEYLIENKDIISFKETDLNLNTY
jgi:hypothetical protein